MVTLLKFSIVMIKMFCTLSLIGCPWLLKAQEATEVYLFDLMRKNENLQLSNPRNISENIGYDNQPSFSKDDQYLYYSSWTDNDQTDIIKYSLAGGTKINISRSEGSDYSPYQIPDGKSVSAVVLEKSGDQKLCRYKVKNGKMKVLVDSVVIGYYHWFDKSTVFAFLLGTPPFLYEINPKKETYVPITASVGRSIHRIPNKNEISFIDKSTEPWSVKSYHPDLKSTKYLAPVVSDSSEDLAWTPDGNLLMGIGTVLYQWNGEEWVAVESIERFDLTGITRLAVSHGGNKIALVVNE